MAHLKYPFNTYMKSSTDTLLTLRKKKDIYYDLLNNLCKARMLYERSLFEECFEILSNTIEQAQFYENNEILTIALKFGTGISAPSELSQHDRTGAFFTNTSSKMKF